ncbi:hypothetical protein [uncultured Rubinisphaera sp.]|uniref:hypothetical protein n=1 Tax=uncultured Rubinisphaera sp. TaxID=1678686 RepID=UPI0030D7A0F0
MHSRACFIAASNTACPTPPVAGGLLPPNTVNSLLAAVMAFVRYCEKHGWIDKVPPLEKLETRDVMKGRPITGEEFERMLKVTSKVVGHEYAQTWKFALQILWESGFRISEMIVNLLMIR